MPQTDENIEGTAYNSGCAGNTVYTLTDKRADIPDTPATHTAAIDVTPEEIGAE